MAENENAKSAKPEKKESWFKGLKAEWRKITWPDKATLVKESTAVVIISVILSLVIALVDAIIKFGLDKIIV